MEILQYCKYLYRAFWCIHLYSVSLLLSALNIELLKGWCIFYTKWGYIEQTIQIIHTCISQTLLQEFPESPQKSQAKNQDIYVNL